jgi:hypothetical protein
MEETAAKQRDINTLYNSEEYSQLINNKLNDSLVKNHVVFGLLTERIKYIEDKVNKLEKSERFI